jgi:hypothetical protein
MAYGLKYTIPFKDVDNYSNVVEIYQDNYVGSSTELIATDVPAVHTYEREDNEDITSSIMSATLTISFYSTDVTDFTSFFSYSDREFLVIHKFEGSTVFKGYLLNDITGEPFQDPPYPVVLTATDGLGQLKEFQMTGPSADTDLGTLIFNQLNSLNLELDFEICNDLYEGLVMDNTKSIFDQAVGENLLIQKDTFTQIQLNAFDFLAEICKTFGWALFQRSNRWIIQRAISRNIDTTTIYIHDWDTFEVKESYTSSALNSAKQWYIESIPSVFFTSSIYANGKFYAVASNQNIYSSVDGITWTTTATTSQYLTAIIYANGKFIAVGFKYISTILNSSILVSTDGVSWTEYNPAVYIGLEAITFGNGKYVAVGQGTVGFAENNVITSTDGINWTLSVQSGLYGLQSIAYGNGKYVAVSSLLTAGVNQIFYSSNGITWNQQAFTYANEFIFFHNNKFTVGNAYSTDGINWISTPSIGALKPRGITFGNGIYVAVGTPPNNNQIAISTDAISWEIFEAPTYKVWNTISFGNNRFVALAQANTNNIMISYVNDEQILEVVADQDKAETDWIPVNADHLLQYQRPYKKLTLVQGGLGQSIISNGENFNENSWYLEGPYKPVDWTVTPDPDSTPIQVFPNNIPSQGTYNDEQGVSWDIRFEANGEETDQPITSKPVFLDFTGLSLDLEVDIQFEEVSGLGIAVKHVDSDGTIRYLGTTIAGSFTLLDWSETYNTFVFYGTRQNDNRKFKLTSFVLPTAGFLSVELKYFETIATVGSIVVTSVKITPTFEGVRNPSEVKKVYETAREYTSIREDDLVFSDLCITASKNWLKIGDLPAIVFVEKSLASTPNIIQEPSGAVTQVNRLTDTLGSNSLSFSGGTVTGAYQRQFVSAAGFTIDSVFILVSSLSGNPPPPSAELNVSVTTISSTQRNVTITLNGYDYTGEANVQIQVFLKDSNSNNYQTSTFLFQVNAAGTFTYTQTNISFENQALLGGYSPTLRDCYARNVLSLYNALSYRLEGSFRRKGNSFGSGFTPVQLDYVPYQNGRYQVIGWEYDLASRVARITFGQVPTAYVYPIS